MEFRVGTVLPAAGCGQRMGLPKPKQFCLLLNRPLISYTLKAFETVPWIEKVVVAASPAPEQWAYLESVLSQYNHKNVCLTPGASARHRSIYNGIKMLCKEGRFDVVVIHDAVRPFVDEAILREVAQAAWEYGAAGAVRPLVSTVVATDLDGFLDQSLDRSKYCASEMPQAFRLDVIRAAYEKATDFDFDYGTECLHIAQKYTGTRVRLIQGPNHLWKVTHKKDLAAAESVIKQSHNHVCLIGCDWNGLSEQIIKSCTEKSIRIDCQPNACKIPETANAHVYLYKEGAQETTTLFGLLSSQTQSSVEHIKQMFGGTVVHIVSHNDPKEVYWNIRKHIEQLSREAKIHNVCVAAVLTTQEADVCHGASMVVDFIYDRNMNFSGQVFVCENDH